MQNKKKAYHKIKSTVYEVLKENFNKTASDLRAAAYGDEISVNTLLYYFKAYPELQDYIRQHKLFENKDFSKTIIDNFEFENFSFVGSRFLNSSLEFSQFDRCEFTDCYFNGSIFSNSKFSECRFERSNLSQTMILKSKFVSCFFNSAEFSGIQLDSFFNGCDLSSTLFRQVVMTDNLFTKCEFFESVFNQGTFFNVNFRNENSGMYEAYYQRQRYDRLTKFPGLAPVGLILVQSAARNDPDEF